MQYAVLSLCPRIPFSGNDPVSDWADQFQLMLNPRCRYNPEYLDGLVAFTGDADENGKVPGQQGMWISI